MGRTVLVVDDDAPIRELLGLTLEADGYAVAFARDGRQALDELERHHPDLVILDWLMPGLDGVGFARELDRRGLRSGVRILLLTADATLRYAPDVGADACLTKPFDLAAFTAVVARLTARPLARAGA
jgi:two-component system phosphate regulon response regulator PhoB